MSDLIQMILPTIVEKIERGNALAEKHAASATNVNKTLKQAREDENSEIPEVVKYQAYVNDLSEKIHAATEQINGLLTENLGLGSKFSEEEREKDKTEHAAIRDEVNTATKLLRMQAGGEEALADIPSLRNFSGRASSGGGSGAKRPRLDTATVNGEAVFDTREKDGETIEYVTFTILATHLSKINAAKAKVTPKMLQEAAFETAGTDDLSTVTEVDFTYSVDGENFDVVVYPVQPTA